MVIGKNFVVFKNRTIRGRHYSFKSSPPCQNTTGCCIIKWHTAILGWSQKGTARNGHAMVSPSLNSPRLLLVVICAASRILRHLGQKASAEVRIASEFCLASTQMAGIQVLCAPILV